MSVQKVSSDDRDRLSRVHDRIERLLEDGCADDVHGRLMGLPWPAQLGKQLLRPAIVTRRQFDRAAETAGSLAHVLRSIGERMLGDGALRRRAGWPEHLDWLTNLDTVSPSSRISGRVDGAIDVTGEFRVLEYNASFVGGVYYCDALAGAFRESTLFERLSPEDRLTTMRPVAEAARALRDAVGRPDPAVGIVSKVPVDLDQPWRHEVDLVATMAAMREHGVRIRCGTVDDVHAGDDDVLVGGEPVDFLVAPPQLDQLTALIFKLAADPVRFANMKSRGIGRFMNGVALSMMMGMKSLLALVSDDAAEDAVRGIDPADVARARAVVPWTRLLRPSSTTYRGELVELVEHVVEHREGFVIKPSLGRGGEGVTLGWQVAPEAWRDAVAAAAAKGTHVVQERVLVPSQRWPVYDSGRVAIQEMPGSFDVFVWNDRRAFGGLSRTMSGGLMNVSQGAALTGLAVLEHDREA